MQHSAAGGQQKPTTAPGTTRVAACDLGSRALSFELTLAVDRRGGRGYTSQQPSTEQRRSAAEARYKQADVVDVWYER